MCSSWEPPLSIDVVMHNMIRLLAYNFIRSFLWLANLTSYPENKACMICVCV